MIKCTVDNVILTIGIISSNIDSLDLHDCNKKEQKYIQNKKNYKGCENEKTLNDRTKIFGRSNFI